MTAKNIYLLLSRDASTDSSDSMNSIIKIIDRFSFTFEGEGKVQPNNQKMLAPINYMIVSSWYFNEAVEKDTKLKFKFQIVQPSGQNPDMEEQTINVGRTAKRVSVNVNVSGLPVSTSGEYQLKAILFNDKDEQIGKANYTFDVDLEWKEKEAEIKV